MQDLLLDTMNRYGFGSSSSSSSARLGPKFVACQMVGSLVASGKVNSFCAAAIAEFMVSSESLVVVSRDAVQCINCVGGTLCPEKPLPKLYPGELSAVTSTRSNALVSGSTGMGCLKGLSASEAGSSSSSSNSSSSSSSEESDHPAQHILCVSATPDGEFLATGGCNASVTVWSRDLKILHHLSGHVDWVRFVKFARGNSPALQLFSTGDDGVICLWDPLEGSALSRLAYTRGHSIQVFEVSYNSGLMAVACNGPILALYRCRSNKITKEQGDDVLRLQQIGLITGAHRSTPTAAKFTFDCQWVVSAGEDETLAISSVAEPRRIFVCNQFVSKRHCLTFMNTFTSISVLAAPPSSSVIVIAACASDGTVALWVVDPRTNRTSYAKKIQLHLGALVSMDLVRALPESPSLVQC